MHPASRFLTRLAAAVFFVCAAAAGLVYSGLLPSWRWMNLPVHSTIETLGGVSALLVAMVLLQQNREENNGALFLVGTGFACMGVLDTFHAMCLPGDAFVFLHSAASLAGGFFFALVLLPEKLLERYAAEQRWITAVSLILCLSVGLRALLLPQNVPTIVRLYDGRFTLAAILLNFSASLLFLVSVPALYFRYLQTHNRDQLVLLFLALLFGLAELTFPFSEAWDDIWWVWHLLRFSAYILVLLFVANRHFQLAREVYRRRGHFRPAAALEAEAPAPAKEQAGEAL